MKEPIIRYVKSMKRIVLLICIPLLILILVSLLFAFNGVIGFMIIGGVAIIALFTVYGWYQLSFSMGTVISYERTKEVIHIHTRRKTFTYDAESGCINVKETPRKYICTFATEDSEDKFSFYKRVPFMKPYEECFTEADILKFYPDFQSELEE